MKRNPSWQVLILFFVLITIPYLFAQLYAGDAYTFGGFLLNPKDGNSYLAKMYEGWSGSWLFTLSYTAEKGNGAFLFGFYLVLGKFGRLTGLPIILIYHIARLIGAFMLILSLRDFTAWVFETNPKDARRSLLFSLFGSGLGWLVIGFGWVTSDLWVPEAYPFLASFTNPHFCLGMAVLLTLFHDLSRPPTPWILARLAIYGLLLAIIMPFGIVVAGTAGAVWWIWEWIRTRKFQWKNFLAAFILGVPCLGYQYWATLTDPLLSSWNSQNVTLSPLPWDLAISFMPALLLAIWGIWQGLHRVESNNGFRLAVAWFISGLLMIYFPFSLQRRFMFAYFIPVGILAVVGLRELPRFALKFQARIFPALFSISVLTNVMVILLVCFGILSHSPIIYLYRDEVKAFDYIRTALPQDAVILCAPDTGSLIPGWTGRRVLYGHVYETVNAAENEQLVKELFTNLVSSDQAQKLITQHHVQYVFMGPREKLLGTPNFLNQLKPIYQNETVQIYSW